MRDVNDSTRATALRPGGLLHLDLLAGATAETLVAGILHLGVDVRVVETALSAAGLSTLGLRVEDSPIAGRAGLRVTFVDSAGRPLVAEPETRGGPSRPLRGRRREPVIHPAARSRAPAVAAELTGDAPEDDLNPSVVGHIGSSDDYKAERADAGQADVKADSVRAAVHALLSGASTSGAAVLSALRSSELSAVAKAIAHKAARRTLDGASRAQGLSLEELELLGDEAAHLLIATVAFGALVEELGPVRVTATPVLIEQGADAQLLAVLEGMRVRERDLDVSPTTAVGAALVWSVAHRYGARGDLEVGAQGLGLGPVRSAQWVQATRVSYGPPSVQPHGTPDEGHDAHDPEDVLAFVPLRVDRASLLQELLRAGAQSTSTSTVDRADGPALRVELVAARAEQLDEISRVLFRHGAEEARSRPLTRRRPTRTEVTVAVGRGNKKETVRVVLSKDAGELLHVEPSGEDVLAAARQLRVAPVQVHADAVVASRQIDAEDAEDDENA